MSELFHGTETRAASGDRSPSMDALEATLEFSPLGIGHFDVGGRVLLANRRLCEILGYPPHELARRNFFELTHPDDLPECAELTARLAAGEVPSYRHEKRFIRRDGSVVWTCVTVSAARDPQGRLRFLIGMVEDISQQRDAEERRQRAEERLGAALAASSTVTFRWDVTADHVECDEALLRLWGMDTTARPLPAREFTRNVHPADSARVENAILAALRPGGGFREEFRVMLADGSHRWIRDVGRVFESPGGGLYMVGACTDVTEARQAQEEIRASEIRLRVLANAIPQLVWTGAGDGRRSWFNERWYEFTGLTFAELQGHGWHRVHHPDHGPRVIQGQLDRFARGDVWEDSFPLRRADGAYRWFLARAVPVRDESGAIREWFGSNTDVTEHMEALHEARSAKQLRDDMVAVVAHDLRNPVHTIALAAATLEAERLADAQRTRLLAIVRHTALDMGHLLDDLLDVSRMEAGTFAVARVPVHPDRLLEDMLQLFEARARDKGVAFVVGTDASLPEIAADRDRLRQVLSNLVGNSLKFTPGGGRIEATCGVAGEEIEFVVRDTGPGIDAEHLPRLFERFWKADPATRGGAGLGLAIARGIVEAHGGRIHAESERGVGTTIRFTVPIAS